MSLQIESRSRPSRAGNMTAVMRAARAPNVLKVLRVAVVHEGRIIEERILRDRQRYELFDIRDGAYELCVPSGATGRVMNEYGSSNLGPHAERVRLDDSSRGKIVVGRSTILFQFVVPPPQPTRPQLPIAAQRASIDWSLTIIVAFSFLMHFGFIGSMFSDWLDPVVSDDGAIVKLIDMTHALPAAPIVEDAPTTPDSQATAPTHTQSTTSTHTTSRTLTPAQQSAANAASLARNAEAMKMNLLTSFGGTTAVAGALNRSEIPLPFLDESARDPHGADPTSGSLTLHTTTTIVPGVQGLNTFGNTHGNEPGQMHTSAEPEGPKVDVTTTHIDPPPGIIDIEGPIARLRPSFRSCYVRKGISVDPTMEGKLTIELRIGGNGEVTDVTKVDGAGLSSAVEQCIIERAHNASFNAPGNATRARVPIVFRQQR